MTYTVFKCSENGNFRTIFANFRTVENVVSRNLLTLQFLGMFCKVYREIRLKKFDDLFKYKTSILKLQTFFLNQIWCR